MSPFDASPRETRVRCQKCVLWSHTGSSLLYVLQLVAELHLSFNNHSGRSALFRVGFSCLIAAPSICFLSRCEFVTQIGTVIHRWTIAAGTVAYMPFASRLLYLLVRGTRGIYTHLVNVSLFIKMRLYTVWEISGRSNIPTYHSSLARLTRASIKYIIM